MSVVKSWKELLAFVVMLTSVPIFKKTINGVESFLISLTYYCQFACAYVGYATQSLKYNAIRKDCLRVYETAFK